MFVRESGMYSTYRQMINACLKAKTWLCFFPPEAVYLSSLKLHYNDPHWAGYVYAGFLVMEPIIKKIKSS